MSDSKTQYITPTRIEAKTSKAGEAYWVIHYAGGQCITKKPEVHAQLQAGTAVKVMLFPPKAGGQMSTLGWIVKEDGSVRQPAPYTPPPAATAPMTPAPAPIAQGSSASRDDIRQIVREELRALLTRVINAA